MKIWICPSFILLFTLVLLPTTAEAQDGLTILHPSSKHGIAKVRSGSIVGQVDAEVVATVELGIPTHADVWLRVATKEEKEEFALAVKNMFPEGFVVHTAHFTAVDQRSGKETSREYNFGEESATDLKKFWASAQFREMYEYIHRNRVATVRIVLEGWRNKEVDVSDGDGHAGMTGYFSFSPNLNAGDNLFRIRAFDAARAMQQSTDVHLYYANDYRTDAPEVVDERAPFHDGLFDEHCAGCHDIEIPESAIGGGESVEDNCRACHAGLIAQKSAHFPATAWDCISCHDAGATPKFVLYAEKDYATGICFSCHVGVEEAVTSGNVAHFPATDRCLACHDAHGSLARALLVDDVNTMCASCHEDAAGTPHPVVNHPLRTVRKPSEEPDELDCASCHNPHASENPRLLPSSRKELCKNCHNF
jgi:predicted CXXCH cytochrome family protein